MQPCRWRCLVLDLRGLLLNTYALRSCLRTALNKLPATLEKMSIESGCKTKPRIAIIGAGVTGLTVGKALAETYGNQLELTLIAEKFSPDTTSDRAGGIFNPEVSNSHYTHTEDKEGFERDVHSWAPATFHYFNHLCNSPLRNESGVFRSPMYKFYKKTYQPPSWLRDELYPDYRILSKGEAKDMGLPYQGFESIVTFTTVTVRGTVYLPWLMRVFQERGGLIVKQKIKSFNELSSFDVIINCTGLGARELAGDRFMRPVRGQLVVVKATDPPKVNAIYYNKEFDHSSFVHVIPFKDTILLGGTQEVDEWSTVPDPDVAKEIYEKCVDLVPALKGSEVIGGWACLRPGRERVRLEVEDRQDRPTVIHNYGHGGYGYILSWGCAMETLKLLQQCLDGKGFVMRPQTKL